MPALDELMMLYSNKSATPFATANSFGPNGYSSSTEYDASYATYLNMSDGSIGQYKFKNTNGYVRAARRSTI
jgi:hypothetical protein